MIMTNDSTITVTAGHDNNTANIPSSSLGITVGMEDEASEDVELVDTLAGVDSHTAAGSHGILARGSHDRNHLHDTTATATDTDTCNDVKGKAMDTVDANTLHDKVVQEGEGGGGDEEGGEGLGQSNRKYVLVSCSSCPGKARRTSQIAGLPDYKEPHLGRGRQYWRDIVLGVNDGAF
jgi:hypothetical protein